MEEKLKLNNIDNNLDNYKNMEINNIKWDRGIEMILCKWCDHSKCYYWLSYNAHIYYYRLQSYISLPIMILSTVIGAASFVNVSNFTENMKLYLPLMIGGINIYIGILTTIQQYFKISEYNENFRLCAKAWDKFNRDIELELSKHPDQRKNCGLFLKKVYDDYERLVDTTPNFPSKQIEDFKIMHSKMGGNDYHVHLPGILYSIYPSTEICHTWYMEKEVENNNTNNQWYINKDINNNTNDTNNNNNDNDDDNEFIINYKV